MAGDDSTPPKQRKKYTRIRDCCDCGVREEVRKDNTSPRCRSCAARMNGRKGVATIMARARRGTCPRCGGVFMGRGRYCSADCWRAEQADARLKLECVECGASFEKPPSITKTNASGRFCSRQCYHNFLCRTDRVAGRGSRWRSIRRDILRRAPFCAVCGTTKRLQVHHIIPFRLTQDNDAANLIPLCVKHHRWVESIFVETERHGLPPEAALVWQGMLRERQLATAAKLKEVMRAD